MWGWRKNSRAKLLAEPFPEGWESYLQQNVAHYRLLPEAQRARLRSITRILVAEKRWEGCGGLAVTDEIKVTIAAQASLLLLGIEHDYFNQVPSILVYPSVFLVPLGPWMDEYEYAVQVAGQAVYRGPVILAWDAAVGEGRDPTRGDSVVIHEFAHQLDFLDGSVNGTPALRDEKQLGRWAEVMEAEFFRLRRRLRRQKRTFLGSYAATREAEFFARASERFFTVPAKLRQFHPKLYDVLRDFYKVDPLSWFASSQRSA